MSDVREALTTVMRAARDVAVAARPTRIDVKAALDYVTDVDRRLDEVLTERLSALTPGVPVLSEERPIEESGDTFWIIDPIDGTHNMMTGLPFFGVCAALFDGGGARVSAVLDVVRGAVYSAERGRGAFLDETRLVMPETASTLVGVSSGALDALLAEGEIYATLRKLGKLRNLGSQALHLACVADGRFGFTLSHEARFWDDAAARLVAEEAGARYRSFAFPAEAAPIDVARSKAPLKSLCAHPDLFDRLEPLVERLWPGPSAVIPSSR